ncbi:MAG: NADPH-dependent FMN reductase [Flavobacteriales bacterium]
MPGPSLLIISSSVRDGRKSHRVALHLQRFAAERTGMACDIADLRAYDFPIFHERLKYQNAPSPAALEFAHRVQQAAGVIIVTPEYNGGYPPALKNAVDLLYDEWHRKPVGICTCSDGVFGGSQVITSLQFSLWKIRAWTVPAQLPMPKVQDLFNEEGVPTDPEAMAKRAGPFVDELQWCITAKAHMDAQKA